MLVVLGMVGAACLGPPVPPPDGGPSQLIPCSEAGNDQVVVANAHLDPSCTYTGHFSVTNGGVRLDCRGALIDGTGRSGVGIEIRTPADVTMRGVRIRNCRTTGFLNGIRATRVGFRGLVAGHEYDHALSDIVIEDTRVSNSRGVGIFVDGYVSRVVIVGVTVQGAGSSGIYLEAGSRNSLVMGNQILDNGFRENGPDGSLFTLAGQQFRFWGPGREGLSIDGSPENVIAHNTFRGNAAGGVFLYTNCGEFVNSRPERWFERRTHADRNLIQSNRFEGGMNGVWVGARMSENTFPMECSNDAYRTGPLQSITFDHAADNTIRSNTFAGVWHGVRVEDDGTQVAGNRFAAADPAHHAVVVGTKWRGTELGRPVTGTVLRDNVSTIAGNPSPYRWTYGPGRVDAAGNTALGTESGICAAPPIPVNPFIMVYAAALEPPGAPPTPAPPYVVPRLPALAPCGI